MIQYYNDTTTNLGISGVFTGTARDMKVEGSDSNLSRFQKFRATALADQASAANGFKIEMSNDNVTWRTAAQSALVANTPNHLEVNIVTRYYRVTLTNGATAQTVCMVSSSIMT